MSRRDNKLSMCCVSNTIISLIIASRYRLHHPMPSANAFKMFMNFLANHALLSALWQITFIATIFIFMVMLFKVLLTSKRRHENGKVIATCIFSIFVSIILIASM